MCIAILNKAKILSKETLQRCWTANKDGAGYSYANNGKIYIVKELYSFSKFYAKYKTDRANFNGAFLIHFRIATQGKINDANCHPFKVNSSMAFIHNGVISKMPYDKAKSDTAFFNEDIVKKLPSNFMSNDAILKLLGEFIGYSKLVFLDGQSNWVIINENLGKWDGDDWYSNNSYKPYEAPVFSSNYVPYVGYKTMNKADNNIAFMAAKVAAKNAALTCDFCEQICEDTKLNSSYNSMLCGICNKKF